MKAQIANLFSTLLPDGAVEFQATVNGETCFAEFHYGDGAKEPLALPPGTTNPTLFAEHRFAVGSFRVMLVIYDDKKSMQDRKLVTWSNENG